MKPILAGIALIVATLTLASCQTVEKRQSFFPAADYPREPLRSAAKDTKDVPTLVAIRFPFAATRNAAGFYRDLYNNRGFNDVFYNPPDDVLDLKWYLRDAPYFTRIGENGAFAALGKTAYVAMEIYRELTKTLPADKVRLQPYMIDVAEVDSVTDSEVPSSIGKKRKILVADEGTPLPPAALYLDVFAFVDPYFQLGTTGAQKRYSFPSTFGRTVSPMVTLSTAAGARPATNGLLAAPVEYFPYARRARFDALGPVYVSATHLDFLNGTDGVPNGGIAIAKTVQSESLPPPDNGVTVLPVVEYEMDRGQMEADLSQVSPKQDAMTSVAAQIAGMAVGALEQIDPREAITDGGLVPYAAQYDPALAMRLRTHQRADAADKLRLEIVRKFAGAEARFITAGDDKFMADTLLSDWGNTMRRTFVLEDDLVNQYVAAREAQQQRQTLQSLTMSMSSFASYSMAATPQAQLMASQTMLQNSIASGFAFAQEQRALSTELQGIARAFLDRLALVQKQAMSFVIEVAGHKIEVTASNLQELRMKLRVEYVKLSNRIAQRR